MQAASHLSLFDNTIHRSWWSTRASFMCHPDSPEPSDRHEGKCRKTFDTPMSQSRGDWGKKRGDEAKVSPTHPAPNDSTLRESCLFFLRLHWRISAKSSHRHLSGSSDDLVRLYASAKKKKSGIFSALFFRPIVGHTEKISRSGNKKKREKNWKLQNSTYIEAIGFSPNSAVMASNACFGDALWCY